MLPRERLVLDDDIDNDNEMGSRCNTERGRKQIRREKVKSIDIEVRCWGETVCPGTLTWEAGLKIDILLLLNFSRESVVRDIQTVQLLDILTTCLLKPQAIWLAGRSATISVVSDWGCFHSDIRPETCVERAVERFARRGRSTGAMQSP